MVILAIIILLFATGCSSLSTWVKSNLEGVPVWVYEPQVSRDQMAFVGRGSANNTTRARILAYESILLQISDSIGEDIVGTYIAELSTREAIDAYRLKVTQDFVRTEGEVVDVFLLAVADRDVLERARTDAEVQLLEKQQQMDVLDQQGAQAFRENKDLVAAEKYLHIATIAHSLPVDRGKQRYEEAIERVGKILESLRIHVATGDPAVPTTVVTVRRGSRSLSPRVIQAAVSAYAVARDGMGVDYVDRQRFVTDSSGEFMFTTNNPTIVQRGVVEFAIDMTDVLEPFKQIDFEVHERFTRILDEKRVPYPYARKSILGLDPLLVAISEYSLQGVPFGSSSAGRALAEELSKDGMRVELTQGPRPDDDEELLDILRAAFPGYRAVIYGNVGISHRKETTDGQFAITVTGSSVFWDLVTGSEIGGTGNVVANAVAVDEQEAIAEAFARYGNISASLLYRYLYR